MNGADYLFATLLLASMAVGFMRGFVREAISLLTWLVGLWLAWHFAYLVNPWLGGALAQPGIREWAGRVIVFLVVLIAGTGVGALASHFVRRAVGLATPDRMLGVVFGALRAVVVIGLLVIAGRAVDLDGEEWWERTRSMPAAGLVADWLERYAEPAAAELLDRATERPGG